MIHKKSSFLLILFVFNSFLLNAQIRYFKMPERLTDKDYLAKTIIFRMKEEFRSNCKVSSIEIQKLNDVIALLNANKVQKKFPSKAQPASKYNRFGKPMEDLTLIYELKYSADIPLEKAINMMLATGELEYAEPHYLPHIFDSFNPDDPYADTTNVECSQWHLKTIKAYEAWAIQQGDTNIVIGIVDTGIDLLHPDLLPNIKINYADPINGIDDDGDGYIDNYYGFDLGENKSSPQWDVEAHGVFISGLSSAYTNNSIGDAGVGFKCKFLPIKVMDAASLMTTAYEGIVYAVDHGCSIVNCSWGGLGGGSAYEQSIINYANNNCNALVVAACGNSNNTFPIYPASYDNVLSVAGTNILDRKYDQSSYGPTVDISAPADSVFSTWASSLGYYSSSSGTSCAAPIVSGAAAIVKAQYPSYSPNQIAAVLMASADNIDTIPFNHPYAGMLGSGRLNLYKALIYNNPYLSMISKNIYDNNKNSFQGGDTIIIKGLFENYLQSSHSDLTVTLSTTCPYVSIIDSTATLGAMATLATKNNNGHPFLVKIHPNVPVSTQIDFKLTYVDQYLNYKSSEHFTFVVNTDYLNIDTNKVATTMTSKGIIGYNQQSSLTQGIGFKYNNGASLLSCGGFIVGNSSSQISDDIYGASVGIYDTDFGTTKIVHQIFPPAKSDFEAECSFNDSLAGSNAMGLSIKNKAYAWNTSPNDKFIIMEYTITNKSTTTYTSLYAGLFMDFDMNADNSRDRINYDATNKMGYTYSSLGGTYAGIKLLSNGMAHHYAIDKNGAWNGTTSSIDIDSGFLTYYKYIALTTERDLAGTDINGNDVADMLSSGPFILQPNDSVTVTFALIAGDNLADIQSSAVAADNVYNHSGISENSLSNAIQFSDVYPNPSNSIATVDLNIPSASTVDISLFDDKGEKLFVVTQGKLSQGNHKFIIHTETLAAGIYHVRLITGNIVITKDLTVVKGK